MLNLGKGAPHRLSGMTEWLLLAMVFCMTAYAAGVSVTPFEISIKPECIYGPCAWDAVYSQYVQWHQRVTALASNSAECDSVSVRT